MRNVLALLLLERFLLAFFIRCGCAARCCWFSHELVLSSQFPVLENPVLTENRELRTDNGCYVFAVAFFFCATVPLRGPLRVRALVCVRCPRTGRLRRLRNPQ